jgi:hypothetical protein
LFVSIFKFFQQVACAQGTGRKGVDPRPLAQSSQLNFFSSIGLVVRVSTRLKWWRRIRGGEWQLVLFRQAEFFHQLVGLVFVSQRVKINKKYERVFDVE